MEPESNIVEVESHSESIRDFASKLKNISNNVTTNNNNLPLTDGLKATQKTSIYRPDIIVSDNNKNITHIIEIETGDGGKSMVGAIFLADTCISTHIKQKIQGSNIKPNLIFIILGSKYNAIKRINAIEPYLKSATHINLHIYTKKEAYKELFNIVPTEEGP